MKNNKGITLIALIITIIILLILAIVTINSITGDDSLIAHAQNAADKYKTEAENENSIIQNYLAKIPKEDSPIDNDKNAREYGDATNAYIITDKNNVYLRNGNGIIGMGSLIEFHLGNTINSEYLKVGEETFELDTNLNEYIENMLGFLVSKTTNVTNMLITENEIIALNYNFSTHVIEKSQSIPFLKMTRIDE